MATILMRGGITILGIILIFIVSCDSGRGIDNELITKRRYCLTNYKDLMLTASELVTEKFYTERNLKDYESFNLDTTRSATLYVKYRFKYNVDDYKMLVSNLIIFEPDEERTMRTYGYYEPTFESGMNSAETRRKQGTKTIDNKLSFGEESHAYEYWKNGDIAGYFLMGRTKNLMVIYSVVGDHVTHHDFIKILNDRIDKINKITQADQGVARSE